MKFLLKNQARVTRQGKSGTRRPGSPNAHLLFLYVCDGWMESCSTSAERSAMSCWIWTQAAFHTREAHAGARVARVRPPESEVTGQVAFKMYAASLAGRFGKVSGFCLS